MRLTGQNNWVVCETKPIIGGDTSSSSPLDFKVQRSPRPNLLSDQCHSWNAIFRSINTQPFTCAPIDPAPIPIPHSGQTHSQPIPVPSSPLNPPFQESSQSSNLLRLTTQGGRSPTAAEGVTTNHWAPEGEDLIYHLLLPSDSTSLVTRPDSSCR